MTPHDRRIPHDPWPRLMREHLTESRRWGASFDDAWRDALAAHPTASDGAGKGGHVNGRSACCDCMPCFARRAFEAGYHRRNGVSGLSILTEDTPRVGGPRVPLADGVGVGVLGERDHCRSGDNCPREVVPGKQFCVHHQLELDRVRVEFVRGSRPKRLSMKARAA